MMKSYIGVNYWSLSYISPVNGLPLTFLDDATLLLSQGYGFWIIF